MSGDKIKKTVYSNQTVKDVKNSLGTVSRGWHLICLDFWGTTPGAGEIFSHPHLLIPFCWSPLTLSPCNTSGLIPVCALVKLKLLPCSEAVCLKFVEILFMANFSIVFYVLISVLQRNPNTQHTKRLDRCAVSLLHFSLWECSTCSVNIFSFSHSLNSPSAFWVCISFLPKVTTCAK